jgi:hypothetical protein
VATTVADADVAVHADVLPFSKELKRKLAPILKAIGKDTKMKVSVDEDGIGRSLKSAVSRFTSRGGRAGLNLPVNVDDRNSRSFFSRIKAGFATVTSAAGKFASNVGSVVGKGFSTLQSIAGPVLTGLALFFGVKLIGLVLTLGGVVAGLAAGLSAMAVIAGAAFGAFALAAVPVIGQIIKGVQGGNREIRKLPKSLQGAARAVQGLQKTFHDWLVPLRAPIAAVVTSFAQLASAILPKLTPLVVGIANSIAGLAAKAKVALGGPIFSEFFAMLADRGPRIFNNLAAAAGHFGLGLIALVNQFAPFAESLSRRIDQIAIRFERWASSVQGKNAVRGFIEWVKTNGKDALVGFGKIVADLPDIFKKLSSKDVQGDLKNLETALKGIAKVVELLSAAFERLGQAYDKLKGFIDFVKHPDLNPFDNKKKKEDNGEDPLTTKVKSAARNSGGGPGGGFGTSGMDQIGQKAIIVGGIIVSALGNAFNTARSLATMALFSILGSIGGFVAAAPARLFALGGALAGVVQTAFTFLGGVIFAGVGTAAAGIGRLVSAAGLALAGLAQSLSSTAGSAMSAMALAISNGGGAVISAIDWIVSTVSSKISSLAGTAARAGSSIISSLAGALSSGVKFVGHAAASMAGAIKDHVPGSPVKKGPLKVLNHGYAGKKIAEMLAGGIRDGTSVLTSGMSNALKPSAASLPQAKTFGRGSTTTTSTFNTPTFNVSSPSADPLQVALAALRQYRLSGAF